MKLQYGIIGFLSGIMLGLLAGIAEMKILKQLHFDTAIPFAIGFTVLAFAFGGAVTGVRRAKRTGG